MSRRAAIVEEFDDDTDLPLPNHPLPNTGSRGPLLQEMHISDDEFEPPRAGPASLPRTLPTQGRSESGSRPSQANASHQVTDTTPYKSCVTQITYPFSVAADLRVVSAIRYHFLYVRRMLTYSGLSQMVVYLPYLHRRKAPLRDRPASGRAGKKCLVAT